MIVIFNESQDEDFELYKFKLCLRRVEGSSRILNRFLLAVVAKCELPDFSRYNSFSFFSEHLDTF
jgi:hypothetical protein